MTADLGTPPPAPPHGDAPVLGSPPRGPATEPVSRFAFNTISELLSVVIHDLANPLQSVTMQLELLGDVMGDPEQAQPRIDSILDTSETFAELLGNLSAFLHRRAPQEGVCQVRSAVTRVQSILHTRLAQRGVLWTHKTLPNMPTVPHDAMLLELVFLRILLLTAYAHRTGLRQSLGLQSVVSLRAPLSSNEAAPLRLQLELRDREGKKVPVVPLERLGDLQKDLGHLGPAQRLTVLADDSLQLDLDLGPHSDR